MAAPAVSRRTGGRCRRSRRSGGRPPRRRAALQGWSWPAAIAGAFAFGLVARAEHYAPAGASLRSPRADGSTGARRRATVTRLPTRDGLRCRARAPPLYGRRPRASGARRDRQRGTAAAHPRRARWPHRASRGAPSSRVATARRRRHAEPPAATAPPQSRVERRARTTTPRPRSRAPAGYRPEEL